MFSMGAFSLPIKTRKWVFTATTMTNFLVVKVPSYNIILGCSILKFLKAIPSTYHRKMKFSTKVRVGEVHSEEVIVRECYVEELKSGEKGQLIDKTLVFQRPATSTLGRLKQMSL